MSESDQERSESDQERSESDQERSESDQERSYSTKLRNKIQLLETSIETLKKTISDRKCFTGFTGYFYTRNNRSKPCSRKLTSDIRDGKDYIHTCNRNYMKGIKYLNKLTDYEKGNNGPLDTKNEESYNIFLQMIIDNIGYLNNINTKILQDSSYDNVLTEPQLSLRNKLNARMKQLENLIDCHTGFFYKNRHAKNSHACSPRLKKRITLANQYIKDAKTLLKKLDKKENYTDKMVNRLNNLCREINVLSRRIEELKNNPDEIEYTSYVKDDLNVIVDHINRRRKCTMEYDTIQKGDHQCSKAYKDYVDDIKKGLKNKYPDIHLLRERYGKFLLTHELEYGEPRSESSQKHSNSDLLSTVSKSLRGGKFSRCKTQRKRKRKSRLI
jgi:thymidylate synthase